MASETTSELAKTVDAALPRSRREQVDQIIRKYTMWSAGLGLIPLPVLDVAAVATAQYKMVGELAKLYDLPFSQERVRVLVGSLLGSGLPAVLAGGGVGSLAKAIPFVGTLAGAAVMPALFRRGDDRARPGLRPAFRGRRHAARFRAGDDEELLQDRVRARPDQGGRRHGDPARAGPARDTQVPAPLQAGTI